ncbi:hypothetical protein FISHEDRAFT_55736 [Fistulina hepatica ATCC 64428]|uniref:Uncharacterized protein n=1 Tax=Fistulina hepatica ATCC 64428 TaxID=1128425 RepID=A0A0D7AN75_9AGAR|nr:hypothetical protein FISHEDRAFT_55736 [Fistulina hepatica ATCC 64428]
MEPSNFLISLPLGIIPTAVVATFTLAIASIIWARTTVYLVPLPTIAGALVCLQRPDIAAQLWAFWAYPFVVPICINIFGSEVLRKGNIDLLLLLLLVGAPSFVLWAIKVSFILPIQRPETIMSIVAAAGWGSLGPFVGWLSSLCQLCNLCGGQQSSSLEETAQSKHTLSDIMDVPPPYDSYV